MFAGSARRGATLTALALQIAAATGCFRSTAPPGWLPRPEDAGLQAFGSWIVVEDRSRVPAMVIEGELIAVDADTIHVLPAGRLISVPRPARCCVTLTAFRMDYTPLALWGAAGVLSTVSHGFALILTAPVWAIAATAVTAAASRAPRIQSGDPAALRPFARFPHGLPPGLDRATLRPKLWPAAPAARPRR